MTETDIPQRIAKVMARAGLCSRREAERWIVDGRVSVDGETIKDPALNVTSANAVIVDGKPMPAAETPRLWRFHKPPGLVTTERDPQGRPTVFDALPKSLPRVLSIGRLDLSSEGLLLFTNDGEVARQLEMPSTGWARRYRVRIFGAVTQSKLDRLSKGVTIEGVRYGSISAEIERQTGSNAWVIVTLKEGKNREIRRVMEYLGFAVNRLIRISYGPFDLGTLERGDVLEVPPGELRVILGRPHKGAKAKPRKPKPGYKAARKVSAKNTKNSGDKPAPKGKANANRRRPV